MFPLIETIKVVDGIPHNLEWHQKRFEYSFTKLYNVNARYNIRDVLSIPAEFSTGLIKARFLYNSSDYLWQFEPQVQSKITSLKLLYDDQIEYKFKYSNRSDLDRLYSNRGKCDDILIVKNDLVTDTYFCNIVFFDGDDWITPRFPLLRGTSRARLLFEKKIKEKVIKSAQINSYISFKLVNAMRDFDEVEELPVSSIYK